MGYSRRQITFIVASLLSMLAGAQTVHFMYDPLADLDQYVLKEKQKLIEENKSEK